MDVPRGQTQGPPGDARRGGQAVLRLPCAQVPIVPVVYSSFSSFYDSRTKLFTSGTPLPLPPCMPVP